MPNADGVVVSGGVVDAAMDEEAVDMHPGDDSGAAADTDADADAGAEAGDTTAGEVGGPKSKKARVERTAQVSQANVHLVTEADVAAGTYSMEDVVLPLPGHLVKVRF